MNRQKRLAPWLGAFLGTLCALLFMVVEGNASDHRAFTEEFHQTYTLSPGGRIDLANINGAVHITGWDSNQVKVDAVKYAGTKERLDEAKIRVSAGSDYISIHTEYPDRTQTFSDDDDSDNPASVEYTLTVPRTARLDEIKLINGSLDISGVNAEVRAASINGHVRAKGLSGRVKLSTINGRLEAEFASLGNSVELSSVNGGVELTLPSDAKAEIEASTVHGGIENDFGLTKNDHRYVGRDLHGELGGGGNRIELRNVNGHIEIRHANDNRALSPARDLGGERASDRDDDDDDN
jgi:DUF4097 and DUF4098 domain-containing protein YvlB